MRKRLLILGVALVLAACAVTGGVVATSSATYTAASSSTASASVAGVSDFLHLYSQTSPDPEGLTGYYNQAGVVPTTLAATGTDRTLTVNLGKQPNTNTVEARVFTIKAASPLPSGVTSITVAISDTNDPSNVINSSGFATVPGTTRTTSVTLTAGQKMQCNLRTNVPKPSGTVYTPSLVIKVTYSGYTGAMFTYTVPVTVTAS